MKDCNRSYSKRKKDTDIMFTTDLQCAIDTVNQLRLDIDDLTLSVSPNSDEYIKLHEMAAYIESIRRDMEKMMPTYRSILSDNISDSMVDRINYAVSEIEDMCNSVNDVILYREVLESRYHIKPTQWGYTFE